MFYEVVSRRPALLWLAMATLLSLYPVNTAAAQQEQADDFEAALAASGKDKSTTTSATTPATGGDGARGSVERGRGSNARSRYDMRNRLTAEERRSSANRAPRGLVPLEFRGKPASPKDLEAADMAIVRRELDPYAYLVGATAGTVLPPEARLVACGGNSRHLFYTLGTEDVILLHNLSVREGVRAGRYTEWTVPEAPKVAPGASPATTIAKAAAFLTAHGYRAVPTWLEPHLFAPIGERPGRASVRVNITKDARMAMAFCSYAGEAPPPSGPGIEVRVHFP